MELHDGILQTLTGASLQIAVARRLIRVDPEAAENVLAALGETVRAEQQEMRLYVDEVKGQSPLWPDADHDLGARITAMLDRVRAIWGVATSLQADVDSDLSAEMGRRVLRIIQEAAVNSARHGRAKAVRVKVGRDGPDITIDVSDDGRGFSFLGDYDANELREKRLGPVSLKHRVEDAGGWLSIHSTREGASLCIRLPAPPDATA